MPSRVRFDTDTFLTSSNLAIDLLKIQLWERIKILNFGHTVSNVEVCCWFFQLTSVMQERSNNWWVGCFRTSHQQNHSTIHYRRSCYLWSDALFWGIFQNSLFSNELLILVKKWIRPPFYTFFVCLNISMTKMKQIFQCSE